MHKCRVTLSVEDYSNGRSFGEHAWGAKMLRAVCVSKMHMPVYLPNTNESQECCWHQAVVLTHENEFHIQ